MDHITPTVMLKLIRKLGHQKIQKLGVNTTETSVMYYISGHSGCSQDSIANNICVDKTTITKAIQKLESAELVCRKTDSIDKRKRNLTLTQKGSDILKELDKAHNEVITNIFSCLSEEEKTQFHSSLMKIIDNVEKDFC